MTPAINLATLGHAEKDHLILSLIERLDTALLRIAELEKRLAAYERPPKNPGNSSIHHHAATRPIAPPRRQAVPPRPPRRRPPAGT